ncbi:MAG: YbhN family protein [Synechococcales bacterium]|nr:YbhN family protein [Synechococcales bacterium]
MHRLKPLIRWVILGGCVFFLAKVLREHWQHVLEVTLPPSAWACFAIGLGFTLLAHLIAGWVWGLTLQALQQPVSWGWLIRVYLKTNMAKYLPGNIWHYYGRIQSAQQTGANLGTAAVSVLLEPLLMAASAFTLTLLCSPQILAHYGWLGLIGQWLGLPLVLIAIRPRFLNPVIQYLNRQKNTQIGIVNPVPLKRYPMLPLIGSLAFVLVRGLGFLSIFWAINPIVPRELPLVLSVFSLAWLLGMVVPGAPGGTGVFEVMAIALLSPRFPPGNLLSIVALYRVVSVLAEAIGAGLAWLDEQRLPIDIVAQPGLPNQQGQDF